MHWQKWQQLHHFSIFCRHFKYFSSGYTSTFSLTFYRFWWWQMLFVGIWTATSGKITLKSGLICIFKNWRSRRLNSYRIKEKIINDLTTDPLKRKHPKHRTPLVRAPSSISTPSKIVCTILQKNSKIYFFSKSSKIS